MHIKNPLRTRVYTLVILKEGRRDEPCIYTRTDRGLICVDRNIVHLVEVVVQEALLRMGLDDLAQGLPAQLFGGQSWRLTVYPVWGPETERDRGEGGEGEGGEEGEEE